MQRRPRALPVPDVIVPMAYGLCDALWRTCQCPAKDATLVCQMPCLPHNMPAMPCLPKPKAMPATQNATHAQPNTMPHRKCSVSGAKGKQLYDSAILFYTILYYVINGDSVAQIAIAAAAIAIALSMP